ncbi:MAG: UbiX family flavin prenyltransferase [Candidatus Lokiarchaeota archaeon]|nr:UbiX family flavin prenyltransferase [Candidatus Lokiarchaeota archaeon]
MRKKILIDVKNLVLVAITGASGVDLAVILLQELKKKRLQTELIISKVAEKIINIETDYKVNQIVDLVDKYHEVDDLTAGPASGSYKNKIMIIIPCSMKTLAAIANGYADNLITRAADVTIKERRKLILVVRESPFNAIHLENMLKLSRLGVVISPPIPSYYIKPKSIKELNENLIGRILDHMYIDSGIKRWGGKQI